MFTCMSIVLSSYLCVCMCVYFVCVCVCMFVCGCLCAHISVCYPHCSHLHRNVRLINYSAPIEVFSRNIFVWLLSHLFNYLWPRKRTPLFSPGGRESHILIYKISSSSALGGGWTQNMNWAKHLSTVSAITTEVGEMEKLLWPGKRELTENGWNMIAEMHQHPDLLNCLGARRTADDLAWQF